MFSSQKKKKIWKLARNFYRNCRVIHKQLEVVENNYENKIIARVSLNPLGFNILWVSLESNIVGLNGKITWCVDKLVWTLTYNKKKKLQTTLLISPIASIMVNIIVLKFY